MNSQAKKKTLWKPSTVVMQIFMTIAAIGFLVPILMVVNYSFKTKQELYTTSPLSLPAALNFDNYVTAFKRLDLLTTFTNTLLYTAISVALLVLICGAISWAIARNRGKIFRFFYTYFLLGILIPYQALFLPIYINGFNFGLVNTRFGIIFMYIATGVSFGVFMMTSFMSTIPVELEEAARIDGCSIYRIYFRIVLPLLKPAIATFAIMQSFTIWNDYLMASLFASQNDLRTMTVVMQQLFSQQTSDYTTAFAGIVISVLPVTILFLCLQKYFVKGMTVGAVKG